MKALAHRYARALAEVAVEQKKTDEIRKELAEVARFMKESADLRNLMASPAVAREKKQAVIDAIAKRAGVSKAVRNFLFVLIDNRRTSLLPQIQDAFEAQLLERMGVKQARVTSARELSPAEKAELGKALEKLTGKRVQAQFEEDPGLIGGAVVRIGSTVYDGSVRKQLNRLRTALAQD